MSLNGEDREADVYGKRPDKKENAVRPSDTINASAINNEYPFPKKDLERSGTASPQL